MAHCFNVADSGMGVKGNVMVTRGQTPLGGV